MTLRGVPKTAEHAAKIAASMRKPRSAEAVRKIQATRKALRGMTTEQKAKFFAKRDRVKKVEYRRAAEQMHVDLWAAAKMGAVALYHDVVTSRGLRKSRHVFDPTGQVSDGFSEGRIWWPLVEVPNGIP